MNGIEVLDRPASPSFYAVAGRLLFIESLDLRLATLVEQLFAGWQLAPVSFPGRQADVEIKLFCGEGPPEIPPGLNQFEIAEGGRCYTGDGAYYVEFSNSVIRLEECVPVSVNLRIKELPRSADAALARATSFAVCAALRRCGLFELHSAGVVDPNGEKGVLIIGPSGSGKSTLTLQLATAGWPYLSDDELLLSLVDGEVEARGFRSFFALREANADANSVNNNREGLDLGGPANGALKRCFEPAGVFSSPPTPRVVPGWLLFTAITGEKETRLAELTQPETMMRLIRACPWATYDRPIAGSNLGILARLARQTRAFDLMAGNDLLEPGRASDFLTPYLRSN